MKDLINDCIEELKKNQPAPMPHAEILQKHIEAFVNGIAEDPECEGLTIGFCISRPAGSKGYVTSLNLAGDSNDCKAAEKALARQNKSTPDIEDFIYAEDGTPFMVGKTPSIELQQLFSKARSAPKKSG